MDTDIVVKIEGAPSSHHNGDSLRQFHILDEIANDSESNHSQSSDSDIPDEEIDKLLEDALCSKNRKKRSADEAGLGELLFVSIQTKCDYFMV